MAPKAKTRLLGQQPSEPTPAPVAEPPREDTLQASSVKKRKPLNLSDEERERRRQSLAHARTLRTQNAMARKEAEQALIAARKRELESKVQKRVESQARKKVLEEYIQADSEEDEEEEIEVVKRRPPAKKQVMYIVSESESDESDNVTIPSPPPRKRTPAPKPAAQKKAAPAPRRQVNASPVSVAFAF
jgi:hypothetical protein